MSEQKFYMFVLTSEKTGKESMINSLKQILSEVELEKCVVSCYGKSEDFRLYIISDQDFSLNFYCEWEGTFQSYLISNMHADVFLPSFRQKVSFEISQFRKKSFNESVSEAVLQCLQSGLYEETSKKYEEIAQKIEVKKLCNNLNTLMEEKVKGIAHHIDVRFKDTL